MECTGVQEGVARSLHVSKINSSFDTFLAHENVTISINLPHIVRTVHVQYKDLKTVISLISVITVIAIVMITIIFIYSVSECDINIFVA